MMKPLALLLVCVLTLLLSELTVRAFFARSVGTRVLLYGTPWFRNLRIPVSEQSAQVHKNRVGDYEKYAPYRTGAYSKYFPYESKVTESADRRETYTVRINNHGFRGKDFTVRKPARTIRVLTLGSSSTFGYHDRDDETYPYYLEQLLNESGGDGRRFEVINFSIPHATSTNILAMFLAEGVPLDPDVVTLYEGANDSAVLERGEPDLAGRLWLALRRRLLTAEFLNYVLGLGVESEGYPWSEELAERRTKEFLRNVETLHEECRTRGIRLVVMTQQLQSLPEGSQAVKGLTYEDEVRLAREKVERGELGRGRVGSQVLDPVGHMLSQFDPTRVLLIHARMMQNLRAWAARSDVGFVDIIAALDHDRDLLVNWVHVKAEGNRKIAAALAPEVLRQVDIRRRMPSHAGTSHMGDTRPTSWRGGPRLPSVAARVLQHPASS
jgi:lysophospholipase L1-like esterase